MHYMYRYKKGDDNFLLIKCLKIDQFQRLISLKCSPGSLLSDSAILVSVRHIVFSTKCFFRGSNRFSLLNYCSSFSWTPSWTYSFYHFF